MSIYVVNVNDPTTPTNSQGALQGAEELRAIKLKLNGLVPGASSNVLNGAKRQTVLTGPLVNGAPSLLGTTAGLTGDLKAAIAAAVFAFCNGFNNAGAQDFIETASADTIGYWPTLAASNTNYVGVIRTAPGVLVPFQTKAPWQFTTTYDRTKQSLLQVGGAAGTVIFLDDFGNAYTPAGGAKVAIDQLKNGTGSIGGSGGANALNGTTDYITSTSFTSLGNGSWSARGYKYITSLAAINTLFDATNAGAFGAQIKVTAAGKVTFNLSSTGTSNDIAAVPVAGAATILVNTWHYYELTYDALAGVYRMYVDGVQDQTVASTAKICAITHINWGGLLSNLTGLVGYIGAGIEFLPYCDHPAGNVYAVPVVIPTVVSAGYASDWVDVNIWLVKSPSAASIVANTNPIFTASNKLYLGEFDTGGVAVSATRTYAYNRIYKSPATALPAVGTAIALSHNLGIPQEYLECTSVLRNKIAENGYKPGDIAPAKTQASASTMAFDPYAFTSNCAIVITAGNNGIGWEILVRPTGSLNGLTVLANWDLLVTVKGSL